MQAALPWTVLPTVLRWIGALRIQAVPQLSLSEDDKVIIMEFDEFWHYLIKKKQKISIFKAYDRPQKHLIDEGCNRSDTTFKRLFERFGIFCFIVTTIGQVLVKSFPKIVFSIQKKQCFRSDKKNSRKCHWFARFHRKTFINSRSLERIEITMRIFFPFPSIKL